jgi:hypothetical protein
MARLSREFVKLETRLLNDWRFFTMSEFEQLTYLKLLIIARLTQNKIPKNRRVIGALLRSDRSEIDIESALNRIKMNFPKFKETKYFYYFDEYELRFYNGAPKSAQNSGVDEDIDEDIDKDIDKQRKSQPYWAAFSKETQDLLKTVYKDINIYQLLGKLKKDRKIELPEEVTKRVCRSYLKNPEEVKDRWAWFATTTKRVWEQYNAEQNIREGQEWKNMGLTQPIKEILAGIGK